MARAYRKLVAGIAAAALLFGALSPLLVSLLFSQRPDVLARVLGLAQRQITGYGDICHAGEPAKPQGATAVTPRAPSEDDSRHDGHGLVCSFCVTAGAKVALPGTPRVLVTTTAAAIDLPLVRHVQPPPTRPPTNHRSRAPPFLA